MKVNRICAVFAACLFPFLSHAATMSSLFGVRSVTDSTYGATCGTTSDDSAAFQAALTAAGNAGGGEVYVPACTGSNYYYFLTALVVPSNVTLHCQKGATLRQRADGVINYPVTNGSGLVGFYGVSNAGIDGCTIDSTGVAAPANQANPIVIGPAAPWVDTTRSENIVVQNMTIRTTSHANGPYMTWVRLANNVKVLNNTYEGGQTTYTASSDNNGIEVLASNNVTVAGNVLRNLGRYGIYMGSFTGAGTYPNNESRDITFINNQIDVAVSGIVLESGADGDGNENYLENIAVYGNSVRDAWKHGIRVGIGGTVSPLTEIYRGVTIANNVVRLSEYSQHPMAMWIEFSSVNGTASGFMVTGNNFYGGQGDTISSPTGLYLNFAKNIQFTGNVWDGGSTTVVTTAAPIVYIPTNPSANIAFTGNYFGTSAQAAFYVGTGTDYALTGNIFNGWNSAVGAGSAPAIYVDGVSNRWAVTGNKFIRGAGSEGYLADGPTTAFVDWTWANNQRSYTPSFNRQADGIWDGTCSTTPGNSPQFGCVTIAIGAATASVTNGKVRSGSRIYLNQTTGDPVSAKAAAGSGTFTVTLASNCATANCTFYYEVMQ